MSHEPIVRELTEAEIREAQTASHSIWSGGLELEPRIATIQEQLAFEGGRMLRYWGLVDEKGTLLSSCKRYSLSLFVEGRPVSAVGFGAVFTPEALRGKGYAARLIKGVMQESQNRGIEAALLFSDIGTAYYEKLGFTPFNLGTFEGELCQLDSGPSLESKEARLEDLPLLQGWFTKTFDFRWVRPDRTSMIWRFFRKRNAIAPDRIFLASGKPVGYFCAGLSRERLWLDEWAVESEHRRAAEATLLQYAKSIGAKTLAGWYHPSWFPEKMLTRKPHEKHLAMVAGLVPSITPALWDKSKVWFGSIDQF